MKMNVKCRFLDGCTGGTLTTDHSASSYGVPVFVPDEYTRDYMRADVYGPADLAKYVPLVLLDASPAERQAIKSAGFRVHDNSATRIGAAPEDFIM
jgi:hypothetical protein